ncbi:TraR/DksA family transcriptional regulator [Candidatus Gottesmanbacteria bacterium]|nr:TraR/DksA family transcriptional regulator [Candidatus Gottesmanbacteria bacterium]
MQSFPSDILDQVRIALEEEKSRVAARVTELSAQDPFANPERVNDNAASDTEASEESNHDRYAAMVDELKARVWALDEALMRVGSGTYGYCVNCGAMIDTDRLAVVPTATLCLSCEAKRKKR